MKRFIFLDDFLILREEKFDQDKFYSLDVATACYVNGKKTLKVLLRLRDPDSLAVFYVLETLKVGSQKYFSFLRRIYFDDNPVISVNLEDFANFNAKCKMLPGSRAKIDWQSVIVESKPIPYPDIACEVKYR